MDDDEAKLPRRAELRPSDSGTAEEALQDYLRQLDEFPPPHDDATRFTRQREIEWYRAFLKRTVQPQAPKESPPFRPGRLKRYTKLLRLKAIALLERGSITIETNGDELRAELHRFPDGSAVLEIQCGGSESLHPLKDEDSLADLFAADLEHALFNPRVRPIAGQEI